MRRELTHITPRFWPQIDGLGDYSRLLASELKEDHGWDSRFIIGDPMWIAAAGNNDFSFPAQAVLEQTANSLTEILSESSIAILHYVPYGYHARGGPIWINRALKQWKESNRRRRLIVIFHELWASGYPWKSEFYFGWIQRRLVLGLHRLADGRITSTRKMLGMLDAIIPGITTFAPIPSCVTPPAAAGISKAEGNMTAVIFGQESSRLLSIKTHAKLITALHQSGVLKELRVIGKGLAGGLDPSKDVALLRQLLPSDKITTFPDLAPTDLANALAEGDLYLSYYPAVLLCKSSALTAAMACGCLPVVAELKNASPLVAGRELLGCDGSAIGIQHVIDLVQSGQIPRLCQNARTWYDANASWDITTSAVAQLLDGFESLDLATLSVT